MLKMKQNPTSDFQRHTTSIQRYQSKSQALRHHTFTYVISYFCCKVASCGTPICSKKCWIKATWINDIKNNVYKTKRKETIHKLFFTISNLKSAKRYKSRRAVLSRKPVYPSISKLMYYVQYFQLCTSTLYFPCFPFFFIYCTWKSVLSIQTIHPCFVKARSLVS